MKKIISFFLFAVLISSCEDVVDVDLSQSKKRLVVNASLNWYRDYPQNTMQIGSNQTIILSQTAGFYDAVVPVENAIVTVTNENSKEVFNFIENENPGMYNCNNFKPVLNNSYTLNINHDGENYSAEETLINTTVIDSIQQLRGSIFDEDQIILKVYYKDNPAQSNYYYFDYATSISPIKRLSVSNDRFNNGNSTYEIISYFSNDEDEKIEVGDEFDIKFFEISPAYYQYLNVLTDQIYTSGIFDPVPAEVKGNVINNSNKSNYPYGYFRVALGNKTKVVIIENLITED